MAQLPAGRQRLNPKQALFVREYLTDHNATGAAIRAGYSKRTAYSQGARLLKHAGVVQEIQRVVNARAKRLDATVDRVIQELMRIATSDIRDMVTVEPTREIDGEVVEGGVRIMPSDTWSEDAAATVAEVSETQHGIRLKTHSKVRALELLAKHLGIGEPDALKLEDVVDLVRALAQATEPFVRPRDLARLTTAWETILRDSTKGKT